MPDEVRPSQARACTPIAVMRIFGPLVGSLALRDNRCTRHCAVTDYPGRHRVIHRPTIEEDETPA